MKYWILIIAVLSCTSQVARAEHSFFKWMRHLYYTETMVREAASEPVSRECNKEFESSLCLKGLSEDKKRLPFLTQKYKEDSCDLHLKSKDNIVMRYKCLQYTIMASAARYIDCLENNKQSAQSKCAQLRESFTSTLVHNRQEFASDECAEAAPVNECLSLYDEKLHYVMTEQESAASVTGTICPADQDPAHADSLCADALIRAAEADVIFAETQYKSVCVIPTESSCHDLDKNLQAVREYLENLKKQVNREAGKTHNT